MELSDSTVKNDEPVAKSSFPVLKRAYQLIIKDSLSTDGEGQFSNDKYNRQTFVFTDDSKLYIRERIKNGYIEFFQYDWYLKNGTIITKFHSEPHTKKEEQTETEPYHLHIKDKAGWQDKRLPNYYQKSLGIVLEHIALQIMTK